MSITLNRKFLAHLAWASGFWLLIYAGYHSAAPMIFFLGLSLVLLAQAAMIVWVYREKEEPAAPAPVVPAKPTCPHFFEVIQVKLLPAPPMAYVQTVALYRCRACGAHSSVVHPGEFSLADFVRKIDEIAELKGMAG